jgi:hypothetical protein
MMASNDAHTRPRLALAWLRIALLIVALGGCGGGAVDGAGSGTSTFAGVGSGGTGAAFQGAISGFGSVIVNGVRIDDSAARITVDDVDVAETTLRLGMVVGIDGVQDDAGHGRADSVVSNSWVEGPVASIAVGAGQLTVLGVAITVNAGTVFDGGITGLAGLVVGDHVEVHGLPDQAGGIRATRIEKNAATRVRLVGTVKASSANTIQVNGITVQTGNAALIGVGKGIAVGDVVRIKGSLVNDATAAATAATTIAASEVREVSLVSTLPDNRKLNLEGIVTKFTSASDFEVGGQRVQAAAGARPDGTVTLGAQVEIEGASSGGTVIATKISVEDESKQKDDANVFHATISALDLNTRTLSLRSNTVTMKWDSNTVFEAATLPLGEASLALNMKLEVTAKNTLAGLIATSIKLRN